MKTRNSPRFPLKYRIPFGILVLSLFPVLGGCPDGVLLPRFTDADFAGTWDIQLVGDNPFSGTQEARDDGYVTLDARGRVIDAGGAGYATMLFEYGHAAFDDGVSGNFRVFLNAPIIGEIEMGSGQMDASKQNFAISFPINDGYVTGVKR